MGSIRCDSSLTEIQILRYGSIIFSDVHIDMVFASIRCVMEPLSSSPPVDDKS